MRMQPVSAARLAAALAVLALAALPARADPVEEIRLSASTIRACLASKAAGAELECLGEVEQDCLVQDDHGPAVTEACARLERRAWELVLNEVFTRRLIDAREGPIRESLRADQATWSEARDRELATAVSPGEDEYVRDTALARTASRLAAQRIADLKPVADDR